MPVPTLEIAGPGEIRIPPRPQQRIIGESYRPIVMQDNPLLYWPLQETSGTTASDVSGNGRNGTYVNSPTLGSTGPIVGEPLAVALNGTNQLITSTYDPRQQATVRVFEGWQLFNNMTGGPTLWGGASGFHSTLRISSGVATEVDFYADDVIGSSGFWSAGWPNTGFWHHWVLEFDDPNDTSEFYLDGVSQGKNTAQTTSWNATANNLQLGATGGVSGINWTNGSYAHFAIYDHLLGREKIRYHYLVGIGETVQIQTTLGPMG